MLEDSDDDDNGGWRSDECVGGVKDSAGVSDLLFTTEMCYRGPQAAFCFMGRVTGRERLSYCGPQ